MLISKFYKILILFCLLVIVLIVVLSLLLINSGPRVRFIQNLNQITDNSLHINSTIFIVFDRQIQQTDYSELISITPSVEFTSKTNKQNIAITFKENLNQKTEYSIRLKDEIRDLDGNKMNSEYTASFKTTTASYAYLDRNHQDDGDNLDQIIINNKGEEKTVFSIANIKSFVANDEYVVAVVKEEEQDSLYAINLSTGKSSKIKNINKGEINTISLAPRGRNILFTITSKDVDNTENNLRVFNYLYSLDLENESIAEIVNANSKQLEAYSIDPDINGRVALIQDEEQNYYGISPFNDFQPIELGNFSESFGFNIDANEVIFRDENELLRYVLNSGERIPIDIKQDGFVRDISAEKGDIFFSNFLFRTNESFIEIYTKAEWESEQSLVWKKTNLEQLIIKNFYQSFDNMSVAVEIIPVSCLSQPFNTSACRGSYTEVVDVADNKNASLLNGVNLVWLP